MSEAIKLGEQLLDCVAGMVTLARLESLLAVKTLPRVLALWLLMLPLMLLTWISFSLLLSWVAYEYLMGALWGFTAFFVLQCIAVASSYFVLQAYKRRMTLPHTRKHLASALRSVQHEFKKAHQEQQ
ncbi:MAG TPA: hypothetical protein VIC08_12960 [Cellvibrionaceae bacterium]